MTARPPTAWRRAPSLSVTEAAGALQCSRSHAYKLADEGKLPTYRDRLGRRRVKPASLEALLVSGGDADLFGGGS